MGSKVRVRAEVQQEQAKVEVGKRQVEKLTVCIESCEKVQYFVDQKKEGSECAKY